MSAIIQASPVEKLSQEPLAVDSFGDAHLYRSRPDVMSQEGLSPEWELPHSFRAIITAVNRRQRSLTL